ncbi:hypothetical protein [Niabella beijingensis]|uniref:hypothetical protein n=1 Tax=Niabella beijingensis TaxID=2872700 RepID=UPI001CBC41C2|nr:hypothetical protein [Niabella beijingensis]MBZ4189481.1 hypothetical protein [Niabella beijingensis]
MKAIILFLPALFISLNLFATAQYPDKILYKEKEYALHSNPLEDYFSKHPDKRPQGGIISTALWRGYVATFEVVDNQLFLKDIEIELSDTTNKQRFATKWKSVLNEVFPGQSKIKITWLTGLLVIPHGKLMNYVHMGYGSTYEKYILLEMNQGDLKKEKNFDHKEYEKFRQRQFNAFRQTEEYKKLKEQMKKEKKYTDEFIDGFLRDFIVNYTSKILAD